MVDPISIAIFGGSAAFVYWTTKGGEDNDSTIESDDQDRGYDSFHDYQEDEPSGTERSDLDTADLDHYE